MELAQGGTLFLDEIGDIPPAMQVKLLRLLQEREFERLGGRQTLKVDVRFVAATHRPLEEMVKKGEFREDLFYRLNVVPCGCRRCAQRGGTCRSLARRFLRDPRARQERPPDADRRDALARSRRSPGRATCASSRTSMERLVVLSDGPRIGVADVGGSWGGKGRPPGGLHGGDA